MEAQEIIEKSKKISKQDSIEKKQKRACKKKSTPQKFLPFKIIQIETESEQTQKIQNRMQIPRFLRKPEEYNQYLEIPVIYLTQDEMEKPFSLIRRLHEEGYEKFGAVKIIPDKNSWNPKFVFDRLKQQVTTRIQTLNDLCKGNAFEQNYNQYTFQEYEKMAKEFELEYQYQTNAGIHDFHRKNEYEYFSILENPEQFEEINIEYAADLPSSKLGSAFNTNPKELDPFETYKQPWNLYNINKAHNSLFQFLDGKQELSGITVPWVYLGMKFASFCFHVEDLFLYALNYHHLGSAKTWYVIPPQYALEFEKVYKDKYPNLFNKKPDIMYHINLMINPLEAQKYNIPVYRTEQQPGEFILSFPRGYHGGFSHGFNCGEAVNIVSSEWFEHYKSAVQDYALKGFHKKVTFSLDWMVQQIIQNLDTTKFDIQSEWEAMKMRELEQRQNIAKIYDKKLKIIEFQNKFVRYDRFTCKTCGSYMYLSYIYCNQCCKSACCSHMTVCCCINNTIDLYIRFTSEDLQEYSDKIEETLQKQIEIEKGHI